MTPSRPYHKNDNAHVEQINYSHVRQLLGYRRLDNREIVSRLTGVMRDYSLLKNLFYPSRKLVSKVVIGSYTKKLFDEPKTPYQRVLEPPLLDECQKERLRNAYSSINPLLFKTQIFSQLRLLLRNVSVASQFEASNTPLGNNLI